MAKIVVRGKILRWGSSYGVRLRKADVEGAGLRPGDELRVPLEVSAPVREAGDCRLALESVDVPGAAALYRYEKWLMRNGGSTALGRDGPDAGH